MLFNRHAFKVVQKQICLLVNIPSLRCQECLSTSNVAKLKYGLSKMVEAPSKREIIRDP